MYKIRHRTSGLYSTGTYRPGWSKTGKTWEKIDQVQLHLRQVISANTHGQSYATADIVEMEMSEIKTEDVLSKIHDIMAEDFVKQQDKLKAQQEKLKKK